MKLAKLILSLGTIIGAQAFATQGPIETSGIIGGTTVAPMTTISQRTVMLYFEITQNGQQGAAVCSGSILDASHILTAAHCVDGFQKGYIVFSADKAFDLLKQAAQSGLASVNGLVTKIDTATEVPGFPGMQNANNGGEFVDLGIISFSGGLPRGFEPAKFLAKSTVLVALSQNQTVTLSGYGMTSAPAPQASRAIRTSASRGHGHTQNPVAPTANPPAATGFPAGVGILRQVDVNFVGLAPQQIDLEFVGRTNHIACEGDSGGPALIQYQGETYVIGVDSRGDCSKNAIYTLVDQENLSAITSTAR